MAIDKIIEGSIEKVTDLTSSYLTLEQLIPKVVKKFTTERNTLRLLNKELGTGSRVSAALRKEMAGLSWQTGIAFKSQLQLLNVTKEYHQGIVASTASTLKFSKATEVNVDLIGKLSAKLNLLGTSNDSTFRSMYENILAVREQYGLTVQQIDSLTSSLATYATTINSINIDKTASSMGIFISKLTSAGMEAEDATKIIENMLNPELVTEAIPLWAKLGIEVSDVVSGDPTTKLEAALPRLKSLAIEISEMAKNNRLAANEMAKIYGLNLSQANQLAKLSLNSSKETAKTLDQYRSEVTTFTESMSTLFTSIGGGISSLILGPVAKVANQFSDSLNKSGVQVKGALTAAALFAVSVVYKKIKSFSGRAAKWFDGVTNGLRSIVTGMSKDTINYIDKVSDKASKKREDVAGIKQAKGIEIDSQLRQRPQGALNDFTRRSMDIEARYTAASNRSKGKEIKSDFDEIQDAIELIYNDPRVKNLEMQIKDLQDRKNLSALEVEILEELKGKYELINKTRSDLRDSINNNIANLTFGDEFNKVTESYNLFKNENSELADLMVKKYSDMVTSLFPKDIKNSLKEVFSDSKAMESAINAGGKNTSEVVSALMEYYHDTIGGLEKGSEEAKKVEEKINKLAEIGKSLTKSPISKISDLKDEVKNYENTVKDFENTMDKKFKSPFALIRRAWENVDQSMRTLLLDMKDKAKEYIKENGGIGKTALHLAGNGLSFIGKNIGKFALGGLAAGAGTLISRAKEDPKLQAALEKISNMADGFINKLLSDDLLSSITGLIERVIPTISGIIESVAPALQNFLEAVAPVLGNLVSAVAPITGILTNVAGWVVRVAAPIVTKIGTALAHVVTFISKILSGVGKLFGINTNIQENTAQTAINTSKNDKLRGVDQLEKAYLTQATYNSTTGIWELKEVLINISNAVSATANNTKNTTIVLNETADSNVLSTN